MEKRAKGISRRNLLGCTAALVASCAVPLRPSSAGAAPAPSGPTENAQEPKTRPDAIGPDTENNYVYYRNRLYSASYASLDPALPYEDDPPQAALLGRVERTGVTSDFRSFDAGVLPVGTALYKTASSRELGLGFPTGIVAKGWPQVYMWLGWEGHGFMVERLEGGEDVSSGVYTTIYPINDERETPGCPARASGGR